MGATGNGLCDSCIHQKTIRNTRGSTFSLCLRSRTDPAYPRYPRVPVLSCAGHEPGGPRRSGSGTPAERGRRASSGEHASR